MAELTAEDLQKKLEELQDKYNDLVEERDKLKVEKSDTVKESMKRKSKIDTLEADLVQARKAITDKEISVSSELQKLKVQNVDLQTQLGNATSKVGELQKGATLDEAIRRVGGTMILPTVYRKTIDLSALDPAKPEDFDNAVKTAFDALNADITAAGFIPNPEIVTVAQSSVQGGIKPPEAPAEFDMRAALLERQKRR